MAKKPLKQKNIKAAHASVNNYLTRIESDIKTNQSKLSMVLGGLIILVIGILIFNYSSKSQPALGPAQQTQQESQDVSADKLPGKYTVKEGDTLFLIAEKYYKDGSKFDLIAKANNLNDVNTIETGQVIEIPKPAESEAQVTQANPSSEPAAPSVEPSAQPTPSDSPVASPETNTQTPIESGQTDLGTGGGNTTVWGSKIDGSTYTVQEGDWLSTISARAYGDIFSYKKIAEANNISNVDYIVPGEVLKIPR